MVPCFFTRYTVFAVLNIVEQILWKVAGPHLCKRVFLDCELFCPSQVSLSEVRLSISAPSQLLYSRLAPLATYSLLGVSMYCIVQYIRTYSTCAVTVPLLYHHLAAFTIDHPHIHRTISLGFVCQKRRRKNFYPPSSSSEENLLT